MKKKQILVINQGKSENLGDKALNIVLESLIEDNGYQVVTAGYSQCKEQHMAAMSLSRKNSRLSIIKKRIPPFFIWLIKYLWLIKEEFKRIEKYGKYDLVIIGGGQLIKTKNVFVYALLTWYWLIKKHIKCPILILGVGADDKFSKLEKLIYKRILSGIDDIYVRDNNSKNIIKSEFGMDSKILPDVAFTYSTYHPVTEMEDRNINLVMIYDYESLKHHFGVNHKINEYYDSWKNFIYNNTTKSSKIVLGYTTIGDKRETFRFANYLRETSNLEFTIAKTDDLDSFTQILGKTNKVLSARMHALILGINYNCEVIPYIISSKIRIFKEEWLDSTLNIISTRREISEKVNKILDRY